MLKRISEGSAVSQMRLLSGMLFVFFIAASLYPTFRLLTIGSKSSTTFSEYLLSGTIDVFILILAVQAFNVYYSSFRFSWRRIDTLVVVYSVTNVIVGFVLANDFLLSVYSFRLTYLPMVFYFFGRLFEKEIAWHTEGLLNKIFRWQVAMALVGLMLYFFFHDWVTYMLLLGDYKESEYYIPRITSILWNPIFFASVMAISGLYFYYRILHDRSWWNYVYFILVCIALVLTMSRGALISFLIGFVFLSLIYTRLQVSVALLGLVVFIFSAVMFVLTHSLDAIGWIFDSTYDTLSFKSELSRVELWRRSLANFFEAPWGYGLGKSGHIAYRFLKDTEVPAAIWATDGWYLKLANETGIYGLLSFVVLTLVYLKNIFRIMIRKEKGLIAFCAVTFILTSFQCIVSNVLDFYYFPFLFWLIIGISVNYFKD